MEPLLAMRAWMPFGCRSSVCVTVFSQREFITESVARYKIDQIALPPRTTKNFSEFKMSDTNKRKISAAESPLQSKTVSKMRLMEQGEITKFQNELAADDNTELKEGIQKLTESGLEYLTDFCKLHKVEIRGASIS